MVEGVARIKTHPGFAWRWRLGGANGDGGEVPTNPGLGLDSR